MVAEDSDNIAIFGDVHGDADRLERALEFSFKNSISRVIFAGDYVNRGKRSRQVLDLLVRAKNDYPGEVILLRGNHEESLLDFLHGGKLPDFAAHGGLATIRSYLDSVKTGAPDEFKIIFPDEHRMLLEETSAFYEDEGILVSHSGFDPQDPASRRPAALYTKGHPEIFTHTGPWPRPLTVCGHYVQTSLQPYDTENLVCLDTGCGTIPGGLLTGLLLPGHKFVQF
ncbi:metallophosphoesterase [Streptomyces microflavus]|uniref:metallophosphoesterase n=1 Tax=Streptomyces microflavus TaxID=1919 RepID=UPI00382F934E